MAEVVPGGIGSDEATHEVEAGVIINGKQQGLLGWGIPPLVDGAVVLPEFSDVSAAEAPVWLRFSRACGYQVGKVRFDIGLDAGAGTLELAEPIEFIRHELIVGRILQGQEGFEEVVNMRWPLSPMISTASSGLVGLPVSQVVGSELIESTFANAEVSGRGCRI